MLSLSHAGASTPDTKLPTKSVRICKHCGGGHFNDHDSLCHACEEPLADAEVVNHVFRIENVATQPAERITANDEERQRQGFELQTTFEWAMRDHQLDVRRGAASDGEGEIIRLAYGPGATITRINKGLRRRANRTQFGFNIDPVSGYWAKNDDEGDEEKDPTVSPRQWIVPSVQDRKNALLLQPCERDLSQETLATVQHALLRGIEAVFQLEEGEILAEPMPTRDERTGFLLYEATEGGAGVLTRLVAEPERIAEVARKALSIMHFSVTDAASVPKDANALTDEPGTSCVAACYRCLMSYFNQPDHELIDRRDRDARSLLVRLATSQVTVLSNPVPRRSQRPAAGDVEDIAAWRSASAERGLPAPDGDALKIGEASVSLVWRAQYVAAIVGDVDDAILTKLGDLGFDVVRFSASADDWRESFEQLARALGRS